MDIKECKKPGEQFYEIAFGKNAYYQHQGWFSGRITTDDNFTMYCKPKIDKTAPIVPSGILLLKAIIQCIMYLSIDPLGKLGWQSNTLPYETTTAHILEVLTEKASNAYKVMLRKLNISYVIVGKEKLDYKLLMEKLYYKFDIKTLMLGGGGVLNWSFIQTGLCDELSLVMASVADGDSKSPSIFETKEELTSDKPVGFELKNVEVLENGGIWLRYLIKNNGGI